ncbi:MAG: carbohydrate binding family 9 domain-containing protein [Acidobacteria bacterium]|nr:carbohydrate binding family 9 domain-containing protein [Acidobacteriota bacterium]
MRMTTRNLGTIAFAFLSMTLLLPAQAPENQQHGRKTVRALTVDQAPKIDGILSERAWGEADAAKGFVQKDPKEGEPATEGTEVRVLHDGKNLYFGIRCLDSNPGGIVARELRRDNDFANDDSISIIIDTFHDHRNAFLFRTNPRGTQYDALITEEGRDITVSWDEKWEVETRIDETGWTAEFQIPMKSIRFSASGQNSAFGIDFERVIRRKNELTYWNNSSRNFSFNQVSQAGHLGGITEAKSTLRVRVKPYVNGRIARSGGINRKTNYLADIGLEDLKYPITPGLTLDATINTDFAQTEVDDQIINFDRVPVFFPEKREFFLEGAGIFEFGVTRGESIGRAEGTPQIKLYHSRTIGLSKDGKAIPIRAGAKVTGKLGDKFTLGALDAQTDEHGGRPGDNFAVFRLKREILSRSSLGMFLTSRQAEGGDFNRLIGMDQNLVLFQHMKVTGFLGRSFTDGVPDKQWVGATGISWEDDFFNTGFNYSVVEKNFQTDLGFLSRVGVRKYEPRFGIFPRPRNSKTIRQFEFSFLLEHFVRLDDGELDTQQLHFNNFINFQDGSQLRAPPHRQVENLSRPLRLPGGLLVPPGRYAWWFFPVTYVFNPARKITGSLQYRHEKDYYGKGGRRQQFQIKPVTKLTSRFSTEMEYILNRVRLPRGQQESFHQMNSRINYAFSRKWLTSTLIQYNSVGGLLGLNFRLNYIYKPGNNLFIVFNNFTTDRGEFTELDRSLVVKFTHSFDF